ncbi:MAG TPA: glycoside hydrolase family 2 TIM barrel-domain containing protein [Abditibacterium sp.]|jgi:beta-galactosidase
MKNLLVSIRLAIAILMLTQSTAHSQTAVAPLSRVTQSFDADWRFLQNDAPGAQNPTFDDANWRRLNVPHDWSIEGPFDQNAPTRGAGGFLPAGVGWYRKAFSLPENAHNRRTFIEFDGVMANSDVWINGVHLGKRPFGYASFRYEMTPHLRFGAGAQNLLAVRADNAGQPASRWYAGAGIYRHVRLISTQPTHLEQWSTFVTTPQVARENATVNVKNTVVNSSEVPQNVALQVVLLDASGKAVQTATSKVQAVAAGKSVDFSQNLVVFNPQIWDVSSPQMYRAVTRVRVGNRVLDEENTPFGIRHFEFVPATGFWLNGKNLKLKGVCLHHDAGALGAAVPLRAWQRRLEILKGLGVNAIRTAHNPMAPEFLDLCDRMGFLVMNEMFDMWTLPKNPFDYHLAFPTWANIDVRDIVKRDRNHPSVILYSAGNEIRDTPNAERAKATLSSLVKTFHEFDPTRPVTQALFRPNVSRDYDNGLADILDVVGQNYREAEILAAYKQKPTRKIVGTENGHDRAVWLALRDNAPYAGQFLWAGIDYLGESRQWPQISDNFGLLFRTGAIRPMGYQRASWWSENPMVFMTRRAAPTVLTPTDPGYGTAATERRPQVLYPDWTPQNTAPHNENVEVYSNCEQVELFLNDKSLGAKPKPKDDSSRNWQVPFEAGILRAIASNGGKVVANHELRTAGAPAKIALSADKSRLAPSFEDVSYITARVTDQNGVMIPGASDLVTFSVSGPGFIAAVDNSDNSSHEPFQGNQRRAYQGECFALIKANAPGAPIVVSASAPGLASSAVVIQAVASP